MRALDRISLLLRPRVHSRGPSHGCDPGKSRPLAELLEATWKSLSPQESQLKLEKDETQCQPQSDMKQSSTGDSFLPCRERYWPSLEEGDLRR